MRSIIHVLCVLAALLSVGLGGCDPSAGPAPLPDDLEPLLPQEIQIHPFTGTRTFTANGGVTGIDVRLRAIDGFGDETKAIGTFRFELFKYDEQGPGMRGRRVGVWVIDATDQETNLYHWEGIKRMYRFSLGWDDPIPVGERFVLMAVFQSPHGPRLFDQHTFYSGQ